MIALVDYDAGNLHSVQKALVHVGAQVRVTRDPSEITAAEALVLPGVGAFAHCMGNLKRFGLVDAVAGFIREGKPFLGICVGMQLLMSQGEEFGIHPGLGILCGTVSRFPEMGLKVPHIGWNQLDKKQDCRALQGVEDKAFVYFVHSYCVQPEDSSIAATTTDYGVEFVSALNWQNIFATQFHPEKSQKVGLTILRNFVEQVERCR